MTNKALQTVLVLYGTAVCAGAILSDFNVLHPELKDMVSVIMVGVALLMINEGSKQE